MDFQVQVSVADFHTRYGRRYPGVRELREGSAAFYSKGRKIAPKLLKMIRHCSAPIFVAVTL